MENRSIHNDEEQQQVEEMAIIPIEIDDELEPHDQHSTSSTSLDTNDEQVSFPLPRDHSYLSGASHPLLVADQENSNSWMTELAILELHGVVLFPGSTLPVKLRDPALIAYLGHQIEVCRTVPHRQPKVCIGIVTYEHQRRPRDETQQHQQRPLHRLVGRIGTIATIQYTQERTDQVEIESQNHIWRRYQEMTELIFTAVGTGRFEVVAPVPAISNGPNIFQIRELRDIPLLLPPMGPLISTRPTKSKPKHWRVGWHDQVTWNLSLLTSTPYFVYDRNWPWKIVDELIILLQENQGRSNLPHLGASTDDTGETSSSSSISIPKSPTQFSYWLSTNLPLTQTERLELLQISSTLERLRKVREKVLALVQQEEICHLGCARCGYHLAPVSQVFSFDGAEGATSNYVNDHGYIHQITTLRSVLDERHLFFQGPPSTENSWTITYCRYCASFLGWKFQRVSRLIPSTAHQNFSTPKVNCPDTFFGFQSASLRTMPGH